MSFFSKFATVVAGGTGLGIIWYAMRDQTTDSDATGVDFAPPPQVPKGAPSLGVRAVEVGTRLLGTKGDGPKGSSGYHRGPVLDKILGGLHDDAPKLLGKPWCARFVRYCYEVAAEEMSMPAPFPKKLGTLAVVGTWKEKPFDAFKIKEPKVGAALLLGKRHITMIAKVIDPQTVVTVEGNHGDKVDNVKRTLKDEDTIVDVEAWYWAQQPKAKPFVVGGLHMLGAV